MLKILRKDGFASFVEVVVTAVLFVLAALGIFTTISMLRPQGADSARRLEAAHFGKRIIDDLRGQVDARMWDDANSLLSTGSNHTMIINDYIATWWLIDDPSLNMRKLEMEITYNGP